MPTETEPIEAEDSVETSETAAPPQEAPATDTSAEGAGEPTAADTSAEGAGEAAAAADEPAGPSDIELAQNAVHAHASATDGYHFSDGTGSVNVKTKAIRKAAEAGRAKFGELRELIQTMSAYVEESAEYWQSESADYWREGFADAMQHLVHDLEELSAYPRELIAYADLHEGVATETEMLAESAETTFWVEA